MTWQDCTMFEAISHASDRTATEDVRPENLPFDFECVAFTDGTAVACRSADSHPYSEVTPDIDVGDPIWQVYR